MFLIDWKGKGATFHCVKDLYHLIGMWITKEEIYFSFVANPELYATLNGQIHTRAMGFCGGCYTRGSVTKALGFTGSKACPRLNLQFAISGTICRLSGAGGGARNNPSVRANHVSVRTISHISRD